MIQCSGRRTPDFWFCSWNGSELGPWKSKNVSIKGYAFPKEKTKLKPVSHLIESPEV